MPDMTGHPYPSEMELGPIFAALSDPVRLEVVLALAAEPEKIRHCSSFNLPVSKQTRTHHFRVLRESGLIRQVDLGNSRTNQLRTAELNKKFPGLIDLLLKAAKKPAERILGLR